MNIQKNCCYCGKLYTPHRGMRNYLRARFCSIPCKSKYTVIAKTWEHTVGFNLTDTQKAYLAGLVDGEGNIRAGVLSKNPDKYNRFETELRVTNTNLDVLTWIARTTQVGVIGKSKKMKEYHTQCYYWTVRTRKQVQGLLTQLLPFMIIKQERARRILELIEEKESGDLKTIKTITTGQRGEE